MALTDENANGLGTTMLVSPSGGYGNGGLFGGDCNSWIILFLLFGMFGWGNGGFGGFGGNGFANESAALYPWMNQSNQINGGFRDQMLDNRLTGINGAITSGFGDAALGIAGINQNICQSTGNIMNGMSQGFAGTTAAITGAQNAIAQQMYGNQLSDLERSFASQTAITQGMTGLQSQLAQCLKKISDKAKDFFSFTEFETVGTLAA